MDKYEVEELKRGDLINDGETTYKVVSPSGGYGYLTIAAIIPGEKHRSQNKRVGYFALERYFRGMAVQIPPEE